MSKEATSRQVIAAREWLKGRSKAEALRIAGYASSVCDRPETIFGQPAMQAEIARRQELEEKKSGISVEYLRTKMLEIIDKEDVKDSDKLRALELLGRNLGMFTDKLEVTTKEDLVERLQRGRDRVRSEQAQVDDG